MFPTPEHEMEKVLYAADELTGLLGAAMLGWELDTLIARTLRAMQEGIVLLMGFGTFVPRGLRARCSAHSTPYTPVSRYTRSRRCTGRGW